MVHLFLIGLCQPQRHFCPWLSCFGGRKSCSARSQNYWAGFEHHAAPPALKLFHPKDSAALLEEEQRVIWSMAWSWCLRLTDVVSHGQLLGAVNGFLDSCVAAAKIGISEKSEYFDHLHQLRHCTVVDLQFFHERLILDLRRADSFDLVGRNSAIFMTRLVVLQMAMLPEERKGRQLSRSVQKCFQCGSTDHLHNQCPKRPAGGAQFSNRGSVSGWEAKGTRSSTSPCLWQRRVKG